MKHLYKISLLVLCLSGMQRAHAQTELTFYTSMGSFKVALTDTLTPITVDSFKARVSRKFYDGLLFHRVINNFVIQGGDPLGTGAGGPGYSTPDEFNSTLKNVPGSLAMANSGPNTNGSQFYINLVNNSSLNNRYTVFGMVTTGFNIVQAIGAVATNSNDRPLTDVRTDSIRITRTATSVGQTTKGLVAAVYPNPARGSFYIALPAAPTAVSVVNVAGQVVYQTTAQDLLHIDLAGKPRGFYTVRLANATGSGVLKVAVE